MSELEAHGHRPAWMPVGRFAARPRTRLMRKFEGRSVKRSELFHTSRFTLQTSRSSGGRTRTFTRLLNREPPYHWATPDSAKRPVGVEPTLPPWQGSRLPLHHGRIECITTKLSKIKNQEHRAGIEPASPRYDGGILPLEDQCLFRFKVGPQGFEP